MARTPLLAVLARALRRAQVVHLEDESPKTLARRAADAGPSRRTMLAGLALTPLVVACRPLLRPNRAPRVAVVGAGIAGLTCAYRLRQAGVRATVYEASRRVGGRMFTARGQLADGQLAELGAELIDSDHATMHALARELALPLDDLTADQAGLIADTCWFDGQLIAEAELIARLTPIAPRLLVDGRAAAGDDANARAALDRVPLATWLADVFATDELLRRLFDVAYTTEFGLPTETQSALNLLDMFDASDLEPLRVFGDSDERYHLHGGNDALPTALAAQLPDQLAFEHRLTRVAPRGDGVALTFTTPSGEIEVTADRVVVAVPLPLWRTVDSQAVPMPPAQRAALTALGMGTNAKLMLQFAERVWRSRGASGTAFSDAPPLQSTWDTSRGQAGASGVLTNFVGGARGVAMGEGTPAERAAEILPWIDAIWPGSAAAFRPGSALRMHWPTQPLTLGSYACFHPGQATTADLLGQAVGPLHLAGEHTSVDFQGYMEGGAESGARAAREVLAALGLHDPLAKS